MPQTIPISQLLYRFGEQPMHAVGVVAPGGTCTVKRHLEEGGYQGSNLFSMQEYVGRSCPAYFNYPDCKTRFGLGRDYIFLTALPVLRFALNVQDFAADEVPIAPPGGGLLSIQAISYHHHFHFNANEVANTMERIFCGTIPRKCFYTCTVEQFEQKCKDQEWIGWDLNDWGDGEPAEGHPDKTEHHITQASRQRNLLRDHDGLFTMRLKQ